VNVSAQMNKQVKMRLARKDAGVDMFQASQDHVYNMMKFDKYSGFIGSPYFAALEMATVWMKLRFPWFMGVLLLFLVIFSGLKHD